MSSYKSTLTKSRSIFIKHYSKIIKAGNFRNIRDDDYICWICLKKGNLPILDNKVNFDIVETLLYFNIKIDHEDTLSKKLCKICYQFLNIAALFRKVAIQSQDILARRKIGLDFTESKDLIVKTEEIYIGEQIPTVVDQDLDKTKSDAKIFSSELEKHLLDKVQPLYKTKQVSEDDSKDFMVSENEDSSCPSYNQRIQKKEQQSEKITCEICKKVVSRSYYKHHKTMHDPNHKNYQCDVCGKSFRLRCSYYNHSLRHRSDFSYKCQHCPYQGKYKELLKAHMRIHTQEQNYMCTECPAKFRFKSNLNKHILRHKEPKMKCDQCNRAFHSQPDLKQHIDVDHLSIRSHVCDECGKAFGSRKGMMKHQKTVHKRKKMMTGRMPAYLLAQNNPISSV